MAKALAQSLSSTSNLNPDLARSRKWREFQLDINDSNDIIGACIYTKLPAYIFHVQLVHEYLGADESNETRGYGGGHNILTLLSHRKYREKSTRRGTGAWILQSEAFQSVETFKDD